MRTLVKEGKRISRIVKEDYPKYSYEEVYIEVYGSGEQSAQGVKWMITHNLKKIAVDDTDSEDIIENISELVAYLYKNFKGSQKKLQDIRNTLDQ